MFALLALTLSFGTTELVVDEDFTTAAYSQTFTSLSLDGPFGAGDSLFGFFREGSQDWSSVDSLSLDVVWLGDNPGVQFFLTLFDEENQAISAYRASTASIGTEFSLLPLLLTEVGTGDAARFNSLEVRWGAAGDAGSNLVIQSLVGSATPITPVITSTVYAAGQFTMTWTGAGTLPVIVQRRESLETGQWTAIAQGVATGEYTDTDPPAGRAFYRVVVP